MNQSLSDTGKARHFVHDHEGKHGGLPLWERLYMPLAMVLITFGVVAMFSIGLPFFVLGMGMALSWPLRQRRPLFQALLVAVVLFVVGASLLAPLGCTTTVTVNGVGGSTTCDNLLGLTYEGATTYNPPLWPALLGGLTMGATGGSVTYLLRRRGRSA